MTESYMLALDAIGRTVADVESNLTDRLETAVILEVLGYKDEHARELGFPDLFDMAGTVRESASLYAWEEPLRETVKVQQSGLRLYMAGMFYNMGWIIMLAALFMGGQSLWAARDLPVEVSTAVGLGFVLGLIITGGIQQFAAWKLIYYHLQGNVPLSRFVMRRSVVLGMALAFAVAAVFISLAVAVIGLTPEHALLGSAYLMLISVHRLFVTPVFAMKKFVALIALSILALGVMFSSYQVLAFLGIGRVGAVVASQILGLSLLAVVSYAFMHAFVFKERMEEPRPDDPPFYAKRELPKAVKSPRFWTLAYEGFPYILYGTMYFVFLFADRLVSWFGGTGPLAMNYNASYHVGVDIALLMLVPITAVKFPLIYRLSSDLEEASKDSSAIKPSRFLDAVSRCHSKLMTRTIVVSMAFAILGSILAEPIVGLAGGDAGSVAVFRTALVGVILFSIFLCNAVFAMAFRRVGAMAGMLVVASFMAYILSDIFAGAFGPNAAVLGFILSSFFLAMTSMTYLVSVSGRAGFAYYAAF